MRRLIVALALGSAACQSRTLEIESNTQWSGSIGGNGSETIQGSGNRSIDIGTEGGSYCWAIQKQTRTGSLRVYVKAHTITGTDNQGDASTSADFGVVSGCAE